jgi:large subunit ribosomal protein L33
MPKVKSKERHVTMACCQCQRHNYYLHKSRGKKANGQPAKLELSKFCRWCRKHTEHKEAK